MKRWFITGTDTDVGKSVVTACLAASLRQAGHTVIAAKPVASGVAPNTVGDDAALLGSAADHAPLLFATYEAPISPHRAARLESRPLDVPGLLGWLGGLRADHVLVEGVGGWRVPLDDHGFGVPELASAVGGEVVVVAADRLGCLNHTLLTVDAVRAAGHRVAGVVLNQGMPHPNDVSRQTNLLDLASLLDLPVVPLGPVRGWARSELATHGDPLWRALTPSLPC